MSALSPQPIKHPMSALLPSGLMKALSFKQPIAWLIAHGYMQVDDRTWGTPYRGPILIHASKGLYQEYYDYIKQHSGIPLPAKDKLEYGGVVGMAKLVLSCRPQELSPSLSPQQRAQFKGIPAGTFGFLFEQANPVPFMPCAGKLGIFELDVEQLLSAPPAPQAELF
jgi:hypothetical protein